MAIAKWYHAGVSVLHVHRLTMPVFAAAPVPTPAALQPIVLTDVEATHLVAALDEYVAPDRAAGGRIDTLLDEAIDVSGAILSRAESLRADLIALGTHGRSGFQRFMLGSVAEKVLRKAACPVLTVPPRADDGARTDAASPRILCPIDFSKASARALDYAASLARESEGLLTLLHVIELPPDMSVHPELGAYRAARFEQTRLCLAGTLAGLGEACRTRPLVLAGKPYREILRVAAEQQSDLIVMGVQGRGAVDLALFGSTTQHVVRQAGCPVLTLKALP